MRDVRYERRCYTGTGPPGAPETCFGAPGRGGRCRAIRRSRGHRQKGTGAPVRAGPWGSRTGRRALHEGACHSRGVGVRYVVIPCASVAPESRTGSACLGPFSIVRSCVSTCSISSSGVSMTDGHGVPPCPRMLPIRYGGCLLRSKPVHKHWCGVEGGTVLNYHLTDTICIVISKKRN